MARDVELDQLKLEQNYAFQQKQAAWQTQDDAWKRRFSMREEMNRAFGEKQAANDTQQEAWKDLQRVRDRNGPRIEYLNDQQEIAYRNMRDAFDNASSAHDARDGASARMYADQGHRFKAESQEAVTERRALIREIRDARDRHESTKPAFRAAKARFDEIKAEHDRAKVDHEHKQAEFKRTKATYEAAEKSLRDRLEVVRDEQQRRQRDKRSLAEQAGVPYPYLDDVWVSTTSDGTVNIYFGGAGGPNGPGHGHYVMDTYGNVTYRRDPFDEHGGQNFTDAQQEYFDVVGAENASGGEFGFRCRFRGFDAFVESGYRDGKAKIDIYYGPNGPFAPIHHHAVALREDPYTFVFDGLR